MVMEKMEAIIQGLGFRINSKNDTNRNNRDNELQLQRPFRQRFPFSIMLFVV